MDFSLLSGRVLLAQLEPMTSVEVPKEISLQLQGVGLALGSAASPCAGVAVCSGVAVGLSWILVPMPPGCEGVEMVPNMLVIGRLLRNLLGVQRFGAIPSQ